MDKDNNQELEKTKKSSKSNEKYLRIASVKLKRSMAHQINENTKVYDFVCPLQAEIGDYILVETKRSSKVPFQVGLVIDVRRITYKDLQNMDKEARPYGFAVSRLDCLDFEKRCVDVRKRRSNLFKRYKAYDAKAAKKK